MPERRGTTGASSHPVSAFCFEHVGIVDPDFDVEAPVVPRRTQLVLLRMPGGNDREPILTNFRYSKISLPE